RESAGKAAGVLMDPHGSFIESLREYREMAVAGVILAVPDSNRRSDGLVPTTRNGAPERRYDSPEAWLESNRTEPLI
ncbi:MAG: hypothetical protein V4564_19210, partial [Pseudomonadota bacterium]